MSPQELDVIVRIASITLLLAAAHLWLRQETRIGTYLVPLALCLSGFLAGNTPEAILRPSGVLGHICYLLAGFAAVALWWFCLAVFDKSFRPRGIVLGIGLLWILVAAADRGLMGPAAADLGLSRLLVVIGLFMVGHLGWRLISDRPDDMVPERRGARVWVVIALAALLFADLAVDVIMGFDWQPRTFSVLQNAAVLVCTGWLLHLSLQGQAAPHPSPLPHPASSDGPAPSDDPLLVRLKHLIEMDRIYLRPDLSFDQLVQMIGAPDRTVRRLINQQLGFDHFRTFLNHYRVAEARRLLADPARANDKLIAIALDSGFASLATFNRVFKELENCAPSDYRRLSFRLTEARA